MQTAELICVLQVFIVIAVLIPACISDWKRREVSNVYWVILGIFGMIFCLYDAYVAGICWQYILMIFGMLLILIDICFEKSRSVVASILLYFVMFMVFAVPVCTMHGDMLIQQFVIVPLSFVVFYILYLTGIIGGGADVKCLITMGMMFQAYPTFNGFPLIDIPTMQYVGLVISFPFALLFHAALFTLFVFIYIVSVNYRNGDSMSASTYTMDIDRAKTSHVWVKQDVVNGIMVNTSYPQDDPDVYRRLEVIDTSKVRVTPKIPFMIPILIGFLFIVFIGNLLFLPF